MHEMSTMIRLVNLACRKAEQEGGGKVTALSISVGDMTGILPAYLQKYFPAASKGTPAEGASLQIREVPIRVKCLDCGIEYLPEETAGRRCPACGGIRASILSGRELDLDWIELVCASDPAAPG